MYFVDLFRIYDSLFIVVKYMSDISCRGGALAPLLTHRHWCACLIFLNFSLVRCFYVLPYILLFYYYTNYQTDIGIRRYPKLLYRYRK